MIADIVLTDDDQGREYHVEVVCTVRQEIGGAPGYCVDINEVYLTEAVVFFDKQGSEVAFASHDDRLAAARFVELKYPKEIEALCVKKYLAEKAEATA